MAPKAYAVIASHKQNIRLPISFILLHRVAENPQL